MLLQLLLFLLFTPFSSSIDTITPSKPLLFGEKLTSSAATFALGFFPSTASDSKTHYLGIWYNNISIQTVVWVANRNLPLLSTNFTLSLTSSGTLVLSDNSSIITWSSATSKPLKNPVAQLLDSGNFVVREFNDDSVFAWQSFDYPTDTLLPGMKLGWNLKTGLNRNLTAWKTTSDPSTSDYTMGFEVSGYPQIFLWAGDTKKWRTGPWNGVRFSGIPEMKTYSMMSFGFADNSDEVFYSFFVHDPTVITRLIVNQSGITQRLVWIEQNNLWNVFWFAPKDPCDNVSPCGPNGICDPNNYPMCRCLQGFEPKNPSNWDLRDGSDGCVRSNKVDCVNGTDGFVTLNGAKLPDTSRAAVNMELSMEQCRSWCLSNCSCTAYANANISSGIGCIIWLSELTDLRTYTNNGQDLYFRLAAVDLGSESNSSHKSRIVTIVISTTIGILVIVSLGVCVCKRRKKRKRAMLGTISFNDQQQKIDEHAVENRDLDMPLYDLNTIAEATNNFSIENKLGEGGFGPVYKGKLGDEQEIAVKRLARTSVQGLDEFKNEVMLIAKLQHRNLVRLLGCCVQGEERMLIYEYMHNKSLDLLLFDKDKSKILDWQTRYNIVLGIARGLLYLHQDSRFRIIHRDLKASNILLDKEMNPKISDFGMARIFGGDETEVNTRKVVGTYGYMSPEYAMDGIFSVKSDIFSFGVLLLEIISGKKNRGIYHYQVHQNLLSHAWSLWKEDNALELVDESIANSYPVSEALRCIKVGLLCVQERPEDRPTMYSAILMMGSENAQIPQPKQPGFVMTKHNFDSESSSSKQDSMSANQLSVTVIQGR